MNPFTAISPPTNHHEEVSLPCSRFLDVTQRTPQGGGGSVVWQPKNGCEGDYQEVYSPPYKTLQ